MGIPTTVTISSSPEAVLWRSGSSSSSACKQKQQQQQFFKRSRSYYYQHNEFGRAAGGGGELVSSSISRNHNNKTPSTSLFLVVLAGVLASFQLIYYVSFLVHRFSSDYYYHFVNNNNNNKIDNIIIIPPEILSAAVIATSATTATASRTDSFATPQEKKPVLRQRPQTVVRQLTVSTTTEQEVNNKQDKNNAANTKKKNMNVVTSPSSEHFDVLVVVPGLGDVTRISTVAKSLSTLSSSLHRGGFGFACHVYVWNASILEEAQERLGSGGNNNHNSNNNNNNEDSQPTPPPGCIVQSSRGMWTHHMSRVPDLSSTNTTHVALLMDDVDASDVHLVDFLHLMTWSGFGVASPAFDDPIYPSMHVRYNCFFHRTDFVNILLAVFQRNIWDCWQQNMIDTEQNPLGWGMDVAVHQVCNTTLGVMDAHGGVHRSTVTSYDQKEARRQMYEYLTRKVDGVANVREAEKYLHCAGHARPAAFDECQVYWDGSTNLDALNTSTTTDTQRRSSKTVDWTCA